MAKRAFDLGKFLKVSHKEVFYEQDGKTIYLCDKRGCVGIQTDDLTVLTDMEKRGAGLTERAELKQVMKQVMQKHKPEDMFTYSATGIQFPYWDSFDGKKKTLTMFRDRDQEDSVKLADAVYAEIFDPIIVTGGKSRFDPIIMICADCYGVVMPFIATRQYTVNQKDDLKHLLDYFSRLHSDEERPK